MTYLPYFNFKFPYSKRLSYSVHWRKSKPKQYVMNFHCGTTLISDFKAKYPGLFKYNGNRSIIFNEKDSIPTKELTECIKMALTYHVV